MSRIDPAVGAGNSQLLYEYEAGIHDIYITDEIVSDVFTDNDTIEADITAAVTTIVMTTSPFVQGDIIQIADEKIAVTAYTTPNATVERGFDGTVAEAHSSGAEACKVGVFIEIDEGAALAVGDETITVASGYETLLGKGDILRRQSNRLGAERIILTGAMATLDAPVERNFTLDPSEDSDRLIDLDEKLVLIMKTFLLPEDATDLANYLQVESKGGVTFSKAQETAELEGDQRGVVDVLINKETITMVFTTPIVHPKLMAKFMPNKPAVTTPSKVGQNQKETRGEKAKAITIFVKGRDEVEPQRHLLFKAVLSEVGEKAYGTEHTVTELTFTAAINKAMDCPFINYTDLPC